MKDYLESLKIDSEVSARYYRSSIENRTEQQKFLEEILSGQSVGPKRILDAACGGGGTSVHLYEVYPKAQFTLVELNPDALLIAEAATSCFGAICKKGDIYSLDEGDGSYDLVLSMQTLSWLEEPLKALDELVRVCAKGGRIIISSLFNDEHDVDVISRVIDWTRPSAGQGGQYTYTTFSLPRLIEHVQDRVKEARYHRFDIGMDLEKQGKGLGTYTVMTADGRRLQLSGGMLLNWGFLELIK